jgi:hypothetical protein
MGHPIRRIRVGAPGFEPGTSSPPGFSGLWRAARGKGGTWLGYAISACPGTWTTASRHASLHGRLGTNWAQLDTTETAKALAGQLTEQTIFPSTPSVFATDSE